MVVTEKLKPRTSVPVTFLALACSKDKPHLDHFDLLEVSAGGFSLNTEFTTTRRFQRIKRDYKFSLEEIEGFYCSITEHSRSADVEAALLTSFTKASRTATGFIIFEAQLGKGCSRCEALKKIAIAHLRDRNAAVIVVKCGDRDVSAILESDELEFSYIPAKNDNALKLDDPAMKLDKEARTVYEDLLVIHMEAAIEALQKRPAVGVGVLLINRKGQFLLTKRKSSPGLGEFGTCGGRLRMCKSIRQALHEHAREELGMKASDLDLGPLLSCTNMVLQGQHYVDLTFLAVARNDQVRIKGDYRHEAIEGNRLWFDFTDVVQFWDQLFAPVRYAFHRFCTLYVLDGLTTGISESVSVSRYAEKAKIEFPTSLRAFPRINGLPPPEEVLRLLRTDLEEPQELSPLFFERLSKQ
jgi:ADP-ribose pyrophosphatase YjhB (NUDIX family)